MLRAIAALLTFLITTQVFAQDALSPEQLVDSYKVALSKNNVRAFMSLFALSREQDKAALEAEFHQRANTTIISVKILPFSTYETQYKEAKARGAKPAVEPKGWVTVEFETKALAGGVTVKETSVMLFGLRNGRYFFNL